MADTKPGRGSDQFPLRLPDGMRDRIKASAERNGRSMNAEIVQALEEMFPSEPTTDELVRNIQHYLELSKDPEAPAYRRRLNNDLLELISRIELGLDFHGKSRYVTSEIEKSLRNNENYAASEEFVSESEFHVPPVDVFDAISRKGFFSNYPLGTLQDAVNALLHNEVDQAIGRLNLFRTRGLLSAPDVAPRLLDILRREIAAAMQGQTGEVGPTGEASNN